MRPAEHNISYPKYLFHLGRSIRCYEFMGAHPAPSAGGGYVFRVWAPDAKAVSVVGSFNGWDPEAAPMRRLDDDRSIWEAVCESAKTGDCYKFAVTTRAGQVVFKADPYAFASEPPSGDTVSQMASRLADLTDGFRWGDRDWMERRSRRDPVASPMNIYEVHLGSWRRHEDGSYFSYRETADELIPYVRRMGYTHLELLPVMEYPFDGSWGYQSTGYFSVTSRYGSPEDFKYFVNKAHKAGIGVIVDWVPAHFPKDAYGLIEFDGDFLYEDPDPFRREHRQWGTRAFNFGRPEVRSFLISSAAFYLDEYHADGIRVDAVSAMLYLDYCREEGQWRPNMYGGRENLEAADFLKELNRSLLTEYPGALMIAEESTAWPMVTMPPDAGGLGFNFKWNMGWMNDSLEYFKTDPLYRSGSHNKLTFSMTYAFGENYILPISHDEVVHGKYSLLDKMPGDYDSKFSGVRAFMTYMMTHPGKKLLFMGCEFGQFIEWDEARQLDWMLLDYDRHRQLQQFVRELNALYLDRAELWSRDDSWEGFRWIDAEDRDHNVYSYCRMAEDGALCLCVLNLSGAFWKDFRLDVPGGETYERLIDTDMKRFGGSGRRRRKTYKTTADKTGGADPFIRIDLPPLSAVVLERRSD